jgi:hypothetical protein
MLKALLLLASLILLLAMLLLASLLLLAFRHPHYCCGRHAVVGISAVASIPVVVNFHAFYKVFVVGGDPSVAIAVLPALVIVLKVQTFLILILLNYDYQTANFFMLTDNRLLG